MPDSIPEAWKTDNLFLLIGGNPLPNYVAANLLRKDEGILHLIYSPDTEAIAKNLGGYFPDRFKTHPIQDPADRGEIQRIIDDALQNHCKPGTIGLHYTGGTKAMAVHAHQMVNETVSDAVCTYLDSRTKTLRNDSDERQPEIKYLTKPDIGTLFNIHDIALQEEPSAEEPQPVFPQIEEALAQTHSTGGGISAYDQWCRRYLRSHKGRLVEKASQFPETPIPFPDHPQLAHVADAMRQAFGINSDTFNPQNVVDTVRVQSEIKKVKHLVKYLDGLWVEYWTLAAFLANTHTHKLQSIAMSLETRVRLNFEFDVAAMQGYQLYAISCTRSDDKGLCKSKLFEAFTRATQMGGDEAHVGLVCAYANPQMLQNQVAEVWRTANNRMRVFGASDLSKLPEKFAQWLSS